MFRSRGHKIDGAILKVYGPTKKPGRSTGFRLRSDTFTGRKHRRGLTGLSSQSIGAQWKAGAYVHVTSRYDIRNTVYKQIRKAPDPRPRRDS